MASGLGFFDSMPAGSLSSSEDEDEEPAEAAPQAAAAEEAAPSPAAAVAPPEDAEPPSDEAADAAGAKRKRGLLSPDEALQLVGSTASYLYAGEDAEEDAADLGFYNGAEPAAKGVAAYIGTESNRVIEVPDSTVGFLLAGGGKQVKALEAASGCRVVVDRGDGGGATRRNAARHVADATPRKVTLIGSDVALREGERRLQDAVLASGKFIVKTLRCNATQAGAIIGRGGAVVKRLQTATSTHISVQGREEGGITNADAPRTVSIRGAPWNVELASRFIFAALRDPDELNALIADAEAAQAAGAGGGVPAATGGAYGDAAAYAAVYGGR